jgi:hypothetical protein
MYTGWMTEAHLDKVHKFEGGVVDGSMHAPWKDEVWRRDNAAMIRPVSSFGLDGPPGSQHESNARAGFVPLLLKLLVLADPTFSEAAELKLVDLVKGSVVKVGDVLAYKRNFSQLDTTVEKDVIVRLHNFSLIFADS